MADEILRRKLHIAFDPGPAFPSRSLLSRTMAVVEAEGEGRRALGRLKEVALAAALVVVVALLAIGIARLRAITHTSPAKHERGQVGVLALPIVEEAFFSASDAAVEVDRSIQNGPLGRGQGAVNAIELDITHDGGQTWIRTGITPPPSPVRFRLWWLDQQHLIAAVRDDRSPIGVALKASDDGGYHWQNIGINSPGPWITGDMFFLNASEGWAEFCRPSECGPNSPAGSIAPNFIFRTFDSGAHWQQLGSPPSQPGVSPGGLYFADSNRGFIGTVSTDGVGRLVLTRDGGRSWRLMDLPTPPGGWYKGSGGAQTGTCDVYTCTVTGLPIMFGKRGIILVEGPHTGFTYTTSDGGLTWGNPRPLPAQLTQRFITPLPMPLDPSNWWATDQYGTLYRTADGGRTWRRTQPRIPAGYAGLAEVKPVDRDVLWGITWDNFLVRSTDRGSTWSAVKLPTG